MDQLERHGLERFRLDLDVGQIDELHAELLGQGGEDVFFLGEAAFDEQFMQGFGRGREMGLGHPRNSDAGKAPRLIKRWTSCIPSSGERGAGGR